MITRVQIRSSFLIENLAQVIAKISVEKAVKNGVRDGGDVIKIKKADVVIIDQLLGHEKSRSKCRYEHHAYEEQYQRHSNVSLKGE